MRILGQVIRRIDVGFLYWKPSMLHLLCKRRKDVACLPNWYLDRKFMLHISVWHVTHSTPGMIGVYFHLKGLFARGYSFSLISSGIGVSVEDDNQS